MFLDQCLGKEAVHIILPLHYTSITSYYHYIIPPLHHTAITLYLHYIILPLHHTNITQFTTLGLYWWSCLGRALGGGSYIADLASVTMPFSRTIFRKSFKPTERERFTTETLERRWKTRLMHTSVTCEWSFRHLIKTVRSEEVGRGGGRTEERDGVKQILTFTKT